MLADDDDDDFQTKRGKGGRVREERDGGWMEVGGSGEGSGGWIRSHWGEG